jgi:hypothetical protein
VPLKFSPTRSVTGRLVPVAGLNAAGSIQKSWARATVLWQSAAQARTTAKSGWVVRRHGIALVSHSPLDATQP